MYSINFITFVNTCILVVTLITVHFTLILYCLNLICIIFSSMLALNETITILRWIQGYYKSTEKLPFSSYLRRFYQFNRVIKLLVVVANNQNVHCF